MEIKTKAATFAVVALGAVAALGAPAQGASKKTVKVGDNFFSPKKTSVKAGTTVTWRWGSDNADSHDVKLKKGPKGVKRFSSDIASTDFSFKKKLSTKGTYSLICTLHQEMTQRITVN